MGSSYPFRTSLPTSGVSASSKYLILFSHEWRLDPRRSSVTIGCAGSREKLWRAELNDFVVCCFMFLKLREFPLCDMGRTWLEIDWTILSRWEASTEYKEYVSCEFSEQSRFELNGWEWMIPLGNGHKVLGTMNESTGEHRKAQAYRIWMNYSRFFLCLSWLPAEFDLILRWTTKQIGKNESSCSKCRKDKYNEHGL